MGITPLSLAHASLDQTKQIPDHRNDGQMVSVEFVKYDGVYPEYKLLYPDGTKRRLVWFYGQGYAGEVIQENVLLT